LHINILYTSYLDHFLLNQFLQKRPQDKAFLRCQLGEKALIRIRDHMLELISGRLPGSGQAYPDGTPVKTKFRQ